MGRRYVDIFRSSVRNNQIFLLLVRSIASAAKKSFDPLSVSGERASRSDV